MWMQLWLPAPTDFGVFGASHPVSLPVRGRRLQLIHSQDGRAGTIREGTYLRDFDTPDQRWLFSGRAAVYSPTGHIIYQEDAATPQLRAVAFSLETLEVVGEPFVIAQNATAPSVANGRLYLRDSDEIASYDLTGQPGSATEAEGGAGGG